MSRERSPNQVQRVLHPPLSEPAAWPRLNRRDVDSRTQASLQDTQLFFQSACCVSSCFMFLIVNSNYMPICYVCPACHAYGSFVVPAASCDPFLRFFSYEILPLLPRQRQCTTTTITTTTTTTTNNNNNNTLCVLLRLHISLSTDRLLVHCAVHMHKAPSAPGHNLQTSNLV